MDTNTKMCTEITDLVVFRKKLLKFLLGEEEIYLKKACTLEVSSDQIHTRNRRHTVLE